jgi:hypothetical protein
MTDKQYKCRNGDLIEVGKEYEFGKVAKVEVLKILKDNQVISWCEEDGEVDIDDIEDYDYLWQEQPDKDGWIPHTTGKQPFADGVVVELKWNDGDIAIYDAEVVNWRSIQLTHYRKVEDKQEPEEIENTLSYLCGAVQQLKLKMEWVENYLKETTKWHK